MGVKEPRRQFLDLPAELLISCLSLLDCRNLVVCQRVCKLLETLIASTASLQFIIYLHATGHDAQSRSILSSSTRLELLKMRTNAWNNLRYTKEQTIAMSDGDLWELYGGILGQTTASATSVTFHRLPSKWRSITAHEWTLDGFEFVIRDFSMDPSQNLLVLIESTRKPDEGPCCITVHLRNLHTGQHHSLAQEPAIMCHPGQGQIPDSHLIQVSGDYLGILFSYFSNAETELYVWNWKTGVVETTLFGDEMETFLFLTKTHVMVALLTIDEDFEATVPSLLVLDFKRESNRRHAVTGNETGISFLFPCLHEDADILSIELRSDPAPIFTPAFQQELPFHLALDNRLFTASLVLTSLNGQQYSVIVFAPLSTFGSYLGSCPPGKGQKQKVIDWCVWGPQGTRMLIPDRPPSDIWVCYVNGSRFVSLQKMGKKRVAMNVYDFHQPGLSRSLCEDDAIESDYMTDVTVFEAGGVFKEEVRTSLPYRLQRLALDVNHPSDMAVMCTEDHLILVDAHSDSREYRVLSF